jgi:hypothetical protein
MKIFSIHDSKAEAYLPPIYFKTAAEAIRAFSTACEDSQTQFFKYPADFTLVELGEFDEPTASIATHKLPRILSNASEFKPKYATQQQVSSVVKSLTDDLNFGDN